MKKHELKVIGTVSSEELSNISTDTPWQPVVTQKIPFSVINQPNGYLRTFGSACGSLATTSLEGWRYTADIYVAREKPGKSIIATDRYLGSTTPDGCYAILLVPKRSNPIHYIESQNTLDPMLLSNRELELSKGK